jgi:hypothetical protein
MRVKMFVIGRMKSSPSKSMKRDTLKKRSHEEAGDAGQSSSRPAPPNPGKEWKKAKLKTDDILAFVNSGFLWEKEVDGWSITTEHAYSRERNPDEILMFVRFVKRGLALPASDFFKGTLQYYSIEYVNLNPNRIFHISVFVNFSEALMGIKPDWILFQKFFQLKPQLSADDLRVVVGAGVQMREDVAVQYLSYKLIDSNQDWKVRLFYVNSHYPALPKLSGYPPKHHRGGTPSPPCMNVSSCLHCWRR